jgi:hypothetical protein
METSRPPNMETPTVETEAAWTDRGNERELPPNVGNRGGSRPAPERRNEGYLRSAAWPIGPPGASYDCHLWQTDPDRRKPTP